MEPQNEPAAAGLPLESVAVDGVSLRKGSAVRLEPSSRSDILDLSLRGRKATVRRIDMDFEGQVYVGVVVDDDPGRDLGESGRPGHLFFYKIDEIVPIGG